MDKVNEIISLKNVCSDDFSIEFDVVSISDSSNFRNEREQRVYEGLAGVEERLQQVQQKIDELNVDIERLTNTADGMDYMVAVASGVLAGIIDIVFVGEFSLEKANEWGKEKTNNFVVKIAQKEGYKKDDLCGAIEFLEKKYPIVADKATADFGGGLQHHLRDFSHHPTPIGLLFSFLTQFTNKVYGTDVDGSFKIVDLKEGDLILIGKNFHEKVLFGGVNWFFHMVSDMVGSSGSVKEGKIGTGLPGPLVSLLKEVSTLPVFRKLNNKGYKEFSVWISKLYNGTLLGKRDENNKLIPLKFDLRTEIGVMQQLGRQAIPVIINECIVRGFYFIRRLYIELRDKNVKKLCDLKNINWESTLPFKNRTVIRMLTISTGTMTAIDLADAAIESAVKSGGVGPAFISNMIVKVNFVGIGRFAIAAGTDIGMGIKRSQKRNERMKLYEEQIALTEAKVFYKQADMWVAAEDAGRTIEQAYEMMDKTTTIYVQSIQEIGDNLKAIGTYIPEIKEKNPALIESITDILEWG